MTQEDKDILFKDLSARLPYHVKVKVWLEDGTTEKGALDLEHNYANVLLDAFYYNKIKDIKPYFFPLSSMTEEQEYQYREVIASSLNHYEVYDWLNRNHFDYRGLIEKGLAIDATNLNIY